MLVLSQCQVVLGCGRRRQSSSSGRCLSCRSSTVRSFHRCFARRVGVLRCLHAPIMYCSGGALRSVPGPSSSAMSPYMQEKHLALFEYASKISCLACKISRLNSCTRWFSTVFRHVFHQKTCSTALEAASYRGSKLLLNSLYDSVNADTCEKWLHKVAAIDVGIQMSLPQCSITFF